MIKVVVYSLNIDTIAADLSTANNIRYNVATNLPQRITLLCSIDISQAFRLNLLVDNESNCLNAIDIVLDIPIPTE